MYIYYHHYGSENSKKKKIILPLMDRVMASLLMNDFFFSSTTFHLLLMVVTGKYHLSRKGKKKRATWFTILLALPFWVLIVSIMEFRTFFVNFAVSQVSISGRWINNLLFRIMTSSVRKRTDFHGCCRVAHRENDVKCKTKCVPKFKSCRFSWGEWCQ